MGASVDQTSTRHSLRSVGKAAARLYRLVGDYSPRAVVGRPSPHRRWCRCHGRDFRSVPEDRGGRARRKWTLASGNSWPRAGV